MPSLITVSSAAAIQQALNLIDVGGTVRISSGVYNLPMNLANRAWTVFGITPFALRVMKPCTVEAYGAVFRINTSGLAYGGLWAYQVADFHLKGGKFIGSKPVSEGGQLSRPAVLLQDCQRATVDDVHAVNFTQGVNVYEGEGCKLSGVVTEKTFKSGIMVYKSEGAALNRCRIKDAGDGHLSLYISRSTKVSNCLVQETRGIVSAQGITLEVDRGSVVEDCTVEGFYYGIDTKNDSENTVIQDNTLRNNLYQVSIRLGDPLNPQNPCRSITVRRNHISEQRDATGCAVYVGDGGAGHDTAVNYIS